ncbi:MULTISPECIES: hypothetical protein [Streptomyces]|nr:MULTISPECIES: hypothetical protein [Streptomyces]
MAEQVHRPATRRTADVVAACLANHSETKVIWRNRCATFSQAARLCGPRRGPGAPGQAGQDGQDGQDRQDGQDGTGEDHGGQLVIFLASNDARDHRERRPRLCRLALTPAVFPADH